MKKFFGMDSPFIKAIVFMRHAVICGALGYFIAQKNLIAGWVIGISVFALIYAFRWAYTEKNDDKE